VLADKNNRLGLYDLQNINAEKDTSQPVEIQQLVGTKYGLLREPGSISKKV